MFSEEWVFELITNYYSVVDSQLTYLWKHHETEVVFVVLSQIRGNDFIIRHTAGLQEMYVLLVLKTKQNYCIMLKLGQIKDHKILFCDLWSDRNHQETKFVQGKFLFHILEISDFGNFVMSLNKWKKYFCRFVMNF